MRLENMKNDIPETPDFIHNMIQNEVAKQLADNKVSNLRRRKRWTAPKVAAVAAACALAVSTAVYAGVNLYHWFLEKQGSYGVSVKIDAGDAVKKTALPDEVPEVDLSAKYVPEGMSWIDEYHLQYPEHDMTGGFSFSFVLLDKNDLGQVVQDQNVIDSEERTFGKYQGIYLKYNSITESGALNQRIYLVCPDLYRVLMIYIGDDVSKDEAIKVAENLVIGENTNGEYLEKTISAKVDSVQISDDLQLLDQDKIPQEWEEAIDADGKLSTNTLNYVKSGDGIDSLDEIVKSEEVNQKLVYVTVTYTNHSNEEIDHMLYLGALLTLTKENGKVQLYIPTEQAGDGYDYINWTGVAKTGEMVYYSVSENYGNGGNYISSIKPGESVQLNMAWIVNESDLKNLYLNVTGDGASYEFSEYILKKGLVDIRQ